MTHGMDGRHVGAGARPRSLRRLWNDRLRRSRGVPRGYGDRTGGGVNEGWGRGEGVVRDVIEGMPGGGGGEGKEIREGADRSQGGTGNGRQEVCRPVQRFRRLCWARSSNWRRSVCIALMTSHPQMAAGGAAVCSCRSSREVGGTRTLNLPPPPSHRRSQRRTEVALHSGVIWGWF